ncbi:MAG: B12-binding domain-containing radical SAM protein [Candidatus Nitrohelix vancouverensis]|uniref:B12-binding domain-containing radical SAM protein n=1 Tax=Candidatus Nitrohelix vancouverensis TaxID=2705534 RepID=A0A7T0C2G7_9BACT|nr:MAG: B12-binding domain-containing radical SAM protein [Candidatus Nitrohelix vancouverensis]
MVDPIKKNIKVALVHPSTHDSVQSLFTFHKNEGVGHKPPLAVLILATHLKAKGFDNVHCFDAQLDNLSVEESVAQLVALKPDVIGLTVWTDFWYPAWKTAKQLREKLPDCKIILGGPHCSVYPRETLEYSDADFVVRGDGEEVLQGVLEQLANNEMVKEVPGLFRKIEGRVLAPEVDLAMVPDITDIPHPDRLLLPYKRYNSVLNPSAYETTMITSRGCPHKCNFCKMDVQKVYCRTAEQVVEEFRAIAELGITDVQVYDDTFTWSKKRVLEICDGLIANNIKINWAIRDRVKRADPDIYKRMKEAGCYRIHFGVETGSKRILDATGKATTLEEAEHAIQLAKDAGFDTMAYYMFGFPDETMEDAQKTIAFAGKLDTNYAVFAVTIPYPGTALYDLGLERGILPFDFWVEYTKNPTPCYRIPHLLEQHMNREALIKLKNYALRSYYFTPKRLLQEARKLSSWTELKRKSGMAFNILSDSIKPRFQKSHPETTDKNYYMYTNSNS